MKTKLSYQKKKRNFYFNAESSAGGLLPYCLWLMHFITVFFHFQCSSEDTRRRIRRREMIRRNDQKRKFRYWVVLVKKPWQRLAVLRFLLTSKNGLSYMGKGKALLFYETQLTSSALKVFLVVVNLKVSRYQHKSCVYLFGKSDPQIQRYKDTDNLS